MTVNVSERSVGSVMVLRPVGRIDGQSSPEFEATMNEKLGQASNVILDLADVPYVSSAGLRILLAMAKRLHRSQGKFALASLRPEIKEVFRISGLTSVLQIFDSPDGALAALGTG